MYSTSLKTWTIAIAMDLVFLAGLIGGVFYHIPHALDTAVFFLWWSSGIGLFQGVVFIVLPAALRAEIGELECEHSILDPALYRAQQIKAKIVKYEANDAKLFTPKVINALAVSHTYFAYRSITRLVVISMLIIAGHPILATVYAAVSIISVMMVADGRTRKNSN